MPTQAYRCDLTFCKHEPADCRTGTVLDKGVGLCQAHTSSAKLYSDSLAKLYRDQIVLTFNIYKSNASRCSYTAVTEHRPQRQVAVQL